MVSLYFNVVTCITPLLSLKRFKQHSESTTDQRLNTMPTEKPNRALVVINLLAKNSYDYLYRFIEESGRGTIQATLSDDYRRIVKLYGSNATLSKLIGALRDQGAKSYIHKIDLLVMLHGLPGELDFKDGRKATSLVRDKIKDLDIAAKLRLVYNTSCYGDSHSQHFLAAGFDTAIGSKKVNANAAVEFPVLLSLWQFNKTISQCLAPSVPLTGPADAAATAFGHLTNATWKNKVDSRKVSRGNKNLRITS
jgi:hypothetical protein